MARHRTTSVRESRIDLDRLVERYGGTSREPRIRMLLAMHDDPTVPLKGLAGPLGVSLRQIERWWSDYSNGGLDRLLNGQASADRTTTSPSLHRDAAPARPDAALLRFLNAMPTTDDPDLWLAQFHASLKALLHGVDFLVLNVAQTAAVRGVDSGTAMLSRQHESNGVGGKRSALVDTFRTTQTPGEITVAQALKRGISATHYQKPHVVDYYIVGDRYVGTIVLWRERSAGSPIPATTIELLDALHGFIAFAFSDCLKRRQASDPTLSYFHDAIERTAERINLRQRELEVFVLKLVGLSQREIAERLHITECAVAKRAARLYRKAGTHNLLELLTPL